jgi:hypothetical protein
MTTKPQFVLHNRETGEIAFTGSGPTACQAYGIKKGIIKKERSNNFIHLTFGWWAIDRADRIPPLVKKEG